MGINLLFINLVLLGTLLSFGVEISIPPARKRKFHRLSVTIVEDDQAILRILERFFKKSVYNTRSFISPIQAVKALQKDHSDILITDQVLSLGKGNEIFMKLVNTTSLSLILMNRYFNDILDPKIWEEVTTLRSENLQYLQKPFTLSDLRKTLTTLLELNLDGKQFI